MNVSFYISVCPCDTISFIISHNIMEDSTRFIRFHLFRILLICSSISIRKITIDLITESKFTAIITVCSLKTNTIRTLDNMDFIF